MQRMLILREEFEEMKSESLNRKTDNTMANEKGHKDKQRSTKHYT